ncbi:MAG: methyltransferase domain-containing protein [Deltaproteobacteria bacterium]|nr:methyltransferase domain-containing protein [Deltaproteobacteria bacterium]
MPSWTLDQARQYLAAVERPAAEAERHRQWVESELPRFLRTLQLVPDGQPSERCLEIGSMPYTFTMLLKKAQPYELSLVDFFPTDERQHRETVILPSLGEQHDFVSQICDIERDPLPFAAASFAGVLCCEVLEHLTADPIHMLSEIYRVLKPNGWLVLSTPNVASLKNVLALLHGRNIYDPYELVFGPTWRHNREYTAGELSDLLQNTGFTIDHLSIEEKNGALSRRPLGQRILRRLLGWRYRQAYGDQLYVRARRGSSFNPYRPDWLFGHAALARQLQKS